MRINNYREYNSSNNNTINYNLLFQQNKNPVTKNSTSNITPNKIQYQINGYKHYAPSTMNNHQNTQIDSKKFFTPTNNTNLVKSHNMQSYGNILQRNNNDINIIKMRMGFDLLTQKINMIKEQVQLINETNKINSINSMINNNEPENIYLRDKIRINKIKKNNVINNNYFEKNRCLKENISSQSLNHFSPNILVENNSKNYNIIQNMNNNIPKQKKSYIYINKKRNKNNMKKKNYWPIFNSIESERNKHSKNSLSVYKYNSNKDLEFINNMNNNSNNKYYKYSNSIYGINAPVNYCKKIKPKNNHNYCVLIKNKENKESDKKYYRINKKGSSFFANQRLNDFIHKEYNSYQNENNENFDIIKEFGSFDNYFLDNPETKRIETNESNKNNDNKNNDNKNNGNKNNILHKSAKNNFNIYNIINKDQIIQNNYYSMNNNGSSSIKKDFKVDIQKSVSYFGKKDKSKKDNNNIEDTDTFEEEEIKRTKFQENQLKQCSESDIFLPKNSSNTIINSFREKENTNSNTTNINKKINKNKTVLCKDDFFYDLYAEKIIRVEKDNYSIDEEYKLYDIKKRINDKFENKNNYKKPSDTSDYNEQKKEKKKKIKKVRFFEGDNHLIQINQDEKVSKFTVYNHLGNKIYYKRCNFNEYLKKLKNKNNNTKSILINKKIEKSDNTQWNNLLDLINKIQIKNKNQPKSASDKKKSTGFNIKNIESFKKNGVKINTQKKIVVKKLENRTNNFNKIKVVKHNENNKIKNSKDTKNISLYNTVNNKKTKINVKRNISFSNKINIKNKNNNSKSKIKK